MRASTRAEVLVLSVAPKDWQSLAIAKMVRGVSMLVPLPRSKDDVISAYELFSEAIILYPVQKDIESTNSYLAQAMAWRIATNAAAASDTRRLERRKMLKAIDEIDKRSIIDEGVFGRKYSCELDWEERDPPRYPVKALNDGYLGGAVVGYSISDDGRVKDARVLAEVTEEYFGDAALKSMEKWKLKTMPTDGCRTNLLTSFSFVLR